MKYFFILLTGMLFSIMVVGQSAEDSVKEAVNKMFAAMKGADGAALKACFADSAVFQTITKNKEGAILVRNEATEDFIDFISKLSPGAADERISFETVKIDGPLAFAWTPYKFYFNGKFSHCGVNSFQLVRFGGTWKVQYIIDTRRKEGCEE